MTLEFTEFVRKPFVIEAVMVTEENIAEIAKHVGELEKLDNGEVFIRVDRRLVPNVFRVMPGYYMTRMGDHIRCYSKKVFTEQFVGMTEDIGRWVNYMEEAS